MAQTDKHSCESIDFLTNLYNRKFYLDYANTLIESETPFAIFVIDLNHFKLINDVYGHVLGDVVLVEVAKRFKSLHSKDLLFSRFGGDEFAGVYLTTDAGKINALGQKINDLLSKPIMVSESEFSISASIGVSRYPVDSSQIFDLLKLADMAMYQSKKSGTDDHYLISDEINQKLSIRRKMEGLLKKINVNKDLFLEFQPIFDLKTMDLVGAEALVRWNHPTEGVIYPLDFIYVAEEMDIIKDITRWVFIHGLHQIKEWNEKYCKNLKISLNVADSCIHNKIFFTNLQYMLERFKVKPTWLSIELSERSLYVSPDYMRELLVSLSDLGVDAYIHNFGIHPIILSDLKSCKINTIKIDKKYISNMDNEDTMSIINAIILMAHGLEINVSAEGVETQEQYDKLKEYNCQRFQGFYKEKPLSKKSFEEKYLSNNKS